MALTRTLYQWALQSRHAVSHPDNDDDVDAPHAGAPSPLLSASGGMLASFLQAQFGWRSSPADETAAASSQDAQWPRGGVSPPAAALPFDSSLLSRLRRSMRDADQWLFSAARPPTASASTVEHRQTPTMTADDSRDRLTPRFDCD